MAKIVTVVLYFLLSLAIYAQYPEIRSAEYHDNLYRQHQQKVKHYYSQKDAYWPLIIYRYIHRDAENETLLTLSARFTLPYSSVASLNRIEKNRRIERGEQLLIPSVPGLFIFPRPKNELEQLLYQNRINESEGEAIIVKYPPFVSNQQITFLRHADFSNSERLMFLGRLFLRPVQNIRISSRYGWRNYPSQGWHHGIDFVAPLGTAVFAARSGTVVTIEMDHQLYGKYIVISHTDRYQTLYAHLHTIFVDIGDYVPHATVIGAVGDTGFSTGPHLHFEIRINGKSVNPESLIPHLE